MKTLVVFLVLLAVNSSAQLSGIVTIDNTQPASSTNFTSFATFASSLNTGGVSAPLTVNVVANTVFNEQITFNQTPGISATNTITINGNGSTLTFSATVAATPWTLLLSGADFMTFNNLKVTGTGATYALAVHLWNSANNNQFNTCTLTSPTAGTGTGLCPFSISGTSVAAAATGTAGSNNTVNSCTLTGGYYAATFYGPTAAPFSTGNKLLNSLVREFYIYGVYTLYSQGNTIKGNVVERPTRVATTTGYGIYLSTSATSILVEGNHVRKLCDGNPAETAYGIYVSADASAGNENKIRNNLISDLKSTAATVAGIYLTAAAYAWADHNTIILDDATSTAGATYGIYLTGANDRVRNNIIYINRTGTGAKYCIYATTAASPLISNYNVLNMLSTAGTNSIFYYSAAITMANWQTTTGNDLNSSTADPMFLTYVPTNTVINNMCPPIGITTDFANLTRSPVFPDPGAFEFYTAPCNTSPPQNTLSAVPTMSLCAGSVIDISLIANNALLNSGYSVQWQTSTFSALGPFTAINGATLNTLSTPAIYATTWYNAVISCALSGGTSTTQSKGVVVAPTTTNTVPYHEGFESLNYNKLPNCSWAASNMPTGPLSGGTTITYTNNYSGYRVPHTGTNYASFYNTPGGTNYFYSNGIQLTAGITYSAALWFISETAGVNNWSDLSILVGTNQSPSGLMPVASTNGTLTPVLYTLLSNTFTIPTSGLYFIAVKATPGSGSASYLSWDDLSVTLPCEFNDSDLLLTASATTICAGQVATLIGYGANSYSWSTGQTTSSIAVSPAFPTTYTLTGINDLSACQNTLTQFVEVLTSPQVVAYANTPVGCPGKTVNILAQGADSYFWSHGVNLASTIVSPTVTTTYSVVGTNSLGCSGIGVVQVSVNPAPPVSVSNAPTLLCNGDQITLTGQGALSYQWLLSSTAMLVGNPIAVSPNTSATYTLIGTDSKGCEGKTTLSFAVDACTGLNKISKTDGVKIYPNPATGIFTIESGSDIQVIEITDLSGRIITARAGTSEKMNVNISEFANGIYYVKVTTANSQQVIKVIKNNN